MLFIFKKKIHSFFFIIFFLPINIVNRGKLKNTEVLYLFLLSPSHHDVLARLKSRDITNCFSPIIANYNIQHLGGI
jgi:hypothetical protein